MGAKNCPETPRQKMINMMYIVLTAMLALNVAAEVLEAFRVVDSSLTQTIKTVNMKNNQIYNAFEQQYMLNAEKVGEWKAKADIVRAKTDSLIAQIWNLKEELVYFSGGTLIKDGVRLRPDDPSFVNDLTGDTIRIKKDDDLNSPSEMMVTKKRAEELKEKIIQHKEFLMGIIDEDDTELRETILQELDTSDPPVKTRDGGERKSWEVQNFDSKPLIAVLTLLSKIQIDITNAESHVINYLYSQIDASSFKFNSLHARVIADSKVVMQGDEFVARVFLAAEDTTQSPEIIVNGRVLEMEDGMGIYRVPANTTGTYSWNGVIKYKTPEGIFQNYEFEHEYQVTVPSYTVAADKMNVFYLGIKNPITVSIGNVPKENIRVAMTNGRIIEENGQLYASPLEEDLRQQKTKISLYATVGGEERFMGDTKWRVKSVPDPVAKIAGESGGTISRDRIAVEQGMIAVLEDFDFDFKYTVIQFKMSTVNRQGFTNPFMSNSNRFTQQQREQFPNLISGTYIIFDEIKARGDDNSIRDLDPISFKIQ
ncbi:MAG: gliding motility protein GldM [Prolixibacteraceae bacterium]|nr:gliding motility protein GldM [Prolixibacteraceae bacterium]MBN2775007.1 gliding motility protein GldM [Prolixibacteraceae bacterium]